MRLNSRAHRVAKGLVQGTESIIADVWHCMKMYKKSRMPLPPTVAFKCRSMVSFAVTAELMSMVQPKMIKVQVSKLIEKKKFDEFYCVCGCVSS